VAVTFFDSQAQLLGQALGGTMAPDRQNNPLEQRGGGGVASAHLQARRAHLELLVADASVEWTLSAQHGKNELRVEVDVLAVILECLVEVAPLLQASRHAAYTHDRRHECSQAREKACKWRGSSHGIRLSGARCETRNKPARWNAKREQSCSWLRAGTPSSLGVRRAQKRLLQGRGAPHGL